MRLKKTGSSWQAKEFIHPSSFKIKQRRNSIKHKGCALKSKSIHLLNSLKLCQRHSTTLRRAIWIQRRAARQRERHKQRRSDTPHIVIVPMCVRAGTPQSLCLLSTLYLLCNQSHSNKKKEYGESKVISSKQQLRHALDIQKRGQWQAKCPFILARGSPHWQLRAP